MRESHIDLSTIVRTRFSVGSYLSRVLWSRILYFESAGTFQVLHNSGLYGSGFDVCFNLH